MIFLHFESKILHFGNPQLPPVARFRTTPSVPFWVMRRVTIVALQLVTSAGKWCLAQENWRYSIYYIWQHVHYNTHYMVYIYGIYIYGIYIWYIYIWYIYGIYIHIWYIFLTFYSGILSDIYSDILFGILSGIYSDIFSGILPGILSDILFYLSSILSDILVCHSIWHLHILTFHSSILSGIHSGI